MKEKVVCIYHGGCDDGVAAAYTFWSFVRDNTSELMDVEYHPGVFHTPPPDVKGKNVVILDFSYKHEVMKQIQADSASLTWMDHHISAIQDNKLLIERDEDHFVLDTTRCGAKIIFDELYKDDPAKGEWLREFIEYINDRDMWQKKKYGGDAFTMALRTYPQIFEDWDKFAHDPHRLIREGEPMLKAFNVNIEILIKQAYDLNIKGTVVPAVNANRFYCSEVGNGLAKGKPYGVTWEYRDGMFVFSLRSDENGLDVSKVATQFGGGGHKRAAGFSIKSLDELR